MNGSFCRDKKNPPNKQTKTTQWNLTWLLNQLSPVGKVGDVVLWDSLSVSISCLHVHLIFIQKSPSSSTFSSSFSCGSWFWQLSELTVTAGMISWPYAFTGKIIQLLNKEKKAFNLEYCAWKLQICFNLFTCCWELFLLTHAEHYQVNKPKITIVRGKGVILIFLFTSDWTQANE